MNIKLTLVGVSIFTASAFHAMAGAQAPASVLAGAYTAEQAKRGQDVYTKECAACHGDTLAGMDPIPAARGRRLRGAVEERRRAFREDLHDHARDRSRFAERRAGRRRHRAHFEHQQVSCRSDPTPVQGRSTDRDQDGTPEVTVVHTSHFPLLVRVQVRFWVHDSPRTEPEREHKPRRNVNTNREAGAPAAHACAVGWKPGPRRARLRGEWQVRTEKREPQDSFSFSETID